MLWDQHRKVIWDKLRRVAVLMGLHRTRSRADLSRDRWIQSPEC